MKPLLLSVDYELFFGEDSGTVENCMIRPLKHLMEVLDAFEGKMTVFWDILHFYRLQQLAPEVDDLRFDMELIEKQIHTLLKKGHDVQMHLHPHWLDARWDKQKWRFSYNRFSLHRLWDDADPENMDSIMGVVTRARLLLEEVCRKVDPAYRVRVFRAGGYRVEPFGRLAAALQANGLRVDSSAGKGMRSFSDAYPFDFSRLPDFTHYRFDDTVMLHHSEGLFWEFPKGMVKVPPLRRIQFYFLQNFVYPWRGTYGDGKRLAFTRKEQSGHWWTLPGSRYYRLTAEGMDPVRWRYLWQQTSPWSQIVLHSKSLSPRTVELLRQNLRHRELAFYSLRQRLDDLKVYPSEDGSPEVE